MNRDSRGHAERCDLLRCQSCRQAEPHRLGRGLQAGKHSDSQGRQASSRPADLDQMVVNHKLGAAPAVLGHPKTDDPAYAWTAGLKRDGNSLLAKFEDINPAFEAGVGSGAYRNRSVRVLKDPAPRLARPPCWLARRDAACDRRPGHQLANLQCAGRRRVARLRGARLQPGLGARIGRHAAAGDARAAHREGRHRGPPTRCCPRGRSTRW